MDVAYQMPMTIREVVDHARAMGLTYGQYVASYRTNERPFQKKKKRYACWETQDLENEYEPIMDEQEVAALYLSGMRPKEIALRLMVDVEKVKRCVNKHGLYAKKLGQLS